MLRACVGCGAPTDRRRCADCDHRLAGWEWQRLSVRILRRDRYRCAFCGGLAVTVDHILPVSLAIAANPNDPALLRSLCGACHRERHR